MVRYGSAPLGQALVGITNSILNEMGHAPTVTELCEHVKGPDFPTEAEIITPAHELSRIYQTGNGSVRMRA